MEEPRTISSDLIRGHIDTIILNALIDGDKYAQLISETIETASDGKYSINQATLYSSLKRLETIGYVTSYWHDAVDGRRKYFKITDKGRANVENNLSDWAYSKSIIDKLIGLSGFINTEIEIITNTSAPSTTATSTLENTSNQQNDSLDTQISNGDTSNTATLQNDSESLNTTEKPATVDPNTSTTADTNNVDFRAVLGGLIEVQQSDSTPTVADTISTVSENPAAITAETAVLPQHTPTTQDVAGFNATISANVAHSQTDGSNIDYTDLSLKAAKQGYKIRFSSKNSAKKGGSLYINKINFWSIFYTFIIAVIQCGAFLLFFNNKFNIPSYLIIVGGVTLIALPAIFGIIYYKNPKRTSNKQIHADSILTAGIIVFNLLLLTFALGLLLNLNYTDKYNLLYAVVVPVSICLDILILSVLRFFIAKKANFQIKSDN